MANVDEEGVLLVRNLDTGEMMSLTDVIPASSKTSRQEASVQEQGHEVQTADSHNGSAPAADKRGWLTGAKHKMAKMAKKTMTAIQERVDEHTMQRSEYGAHPQRAAQVANAGPPQAGMAVQQPRQSQATSQAIANQPQQMKQLPLHQHQPPAMGQQTSPILQQQLGPLAMARAHAHVTPLVQSVAGSGPSSAPAAIHQPQDATRPLPPATLTPLLPSATSGSISDSQVSPSGSALHQVPSQKQMVLGPLQAALQAERRDGMHMAAATPAAPAIELRHVPPPLLSTALRQQQQQQQGSVPQPMGGSAASTAAAASAIASHPSALSTTSLEGIKAASMSSGSLKSRGMDPAIFARFSGPGGTDTGSSFSAAPAVTHDGFLPMQYSSASQEQETEGGDAASMPASGRSQANKGKGGLHKLQQWGKAKGEKLMSHLAKHAQEAEGKQPSVSQVPAQQDGLRFDVFEANPDGEGIAWASSITDALSARSQQFDQEARSHAEGIAAGEKTRGKLPGKLVKFIGQRIARKKKGQARAEPGVGDGSDDDATLEGQTLDEDDEDEDGTMAGEDQDLYQSHGQALLKAGLPGAIGKPARTRSARGNAVPGRLLANVRLMQALPAHDGIIWVARFHPTGKWLATGGQDGVARIWVGTSSTLATKSSLAPSWQHSSSLQHVNSTPFPLQAPSAAAGGCIIKPSMDVDSEDEPRLARVSPGFGSITAIPSSAPLLSTTSQEVESLKSKPAVGSLAAVLGGMHAGQQLLQSRAAYVLPGHTEDVLDVAWSAGQLLLTASVDGTAKLWHIPPSPASPAPFPQATPQVTLDSHDSSKQSPFTADSIQAAVASQAGGPEPTSQILASLQEYPHPDFVTCVCFHPHDSQLFVSGCADGRVRVWSTMTARVLASAAVQQDMVTCVAWMPGGSRIIAGTLQGKCRHYEWHPGPGAPVAAPGLSTSSRPAAPTLSTSTGCKLEYVTTIDVKDRRASAGCGRKLTSVTCMPGQPDSYLVTSNDSRIRLYQRYSVGVKYKGPRNRNTLVKACVDETGMHVVSGSDNGWVYVWDAQLTATPHGATATSGPGNSSSTHAGHQAGSQQATRGRLRPKNPCYDAFHTPESCVTVAVIAPKSEWRQSTAEAKQQLLASCQHGQGVEMSGTGAAIGPSAMSMTALQPGSPLHGKQSATVAGFSGVSSQQLVSGTAGGQLGGHAGAMGVVREQGLGAAGAASTVQAAAGSIAALHSPLLGGWMVVGGYSGNLLVYENL